MKMAWRGEMFRKQVLLSRALVVGRSVLVPIALLCPVIQSEENTAPCTSVCQHTDGVCIAA
jgi:hypothetical protein